MDKASCPDQTKMFNYVLGKLAPEACDDVASHIDTCPDCQQTLANIKNADDTVVSELRRAAAASQPVVDEPALKQAMAKAAAIVGPRPASQGAKSSSPTKTQGPAPVTGVQSPWQVGKLKPGAPPAAGTAMPPSLDQFTKNLADSGVLEAGELRALQEGLPADKRPADAQALASLLVQQGKLTRFQAQVAYQGKSKGLIFGEYIVLDKIGAGGMGQVYKAHHRRMDRTVALKVLPAAATKSPDAVKRFHREVRAAAKLVHQNIVIAHDAGEANGQHFLVMEFVDGSDLSSLVKKSGPLPIDKAIDYVVQAARGLAYAHGRGIIHRDIKPGNLLLDNEGVVKVLDMGLARFEDPNAENLTGTEQVMGTVDYMAPEQAMSTHTADARADVYSLGVTLWYLLTATKMYDGETAVQRIMKHNAAAIPSLTASRPEIPAALDQFFARMVAKKPEERVASMDEVIRTLPTLVAEVASSSRANEATGAWQRGAVDNDRAAGASPPVTPPSPAADDEGMTAIFGHQKMRSIFAPSEDTSPGGSGGKTIGDLPVVATAKKSKAAAAAKPSGRRQPAGGAPPFWKNRNVLIGASAAGFLFIALGVWLIVRDKDGNQVAKVNATPGTVVEPPPGGTVEVASVTSTPVAPKPTISPSVATPATKPTTQSSVSVLAVKPSSSRPDNVPTDATLFAGGYYKLFKDNLTWHEARDRCVALGGHLAFVTSVDEDKFLNQLADQSGLDSIWVGATDEKVEGQWIWLDGSKLYYTNWDAGQPNNKGTGEHYLLKLFTHQGQSHAGRWADQPAKSEQHKPGFVCQWDAAPAAADFVSLFNGRDLTGWKTDPKFPGDWRVENGVLVGRKGFSYLFTERGDFGDIHLRCEARVGVRTSGGIVGRAPQMNITNPSLLPSYMAKINVDHPVDRQRTGTMYVTTSEKYTGIGKIPSPVGANEWFNLDMIIRDNHVQVLINGQTTTDYTDDRKLFAAGHIALQFYSGTAPLEFRKIEVRELSAGQAGGAGLPIAAARSWSTPEFQKWVDKTRKLPIQKQTDAVSQKLMELNPGFDGKLTDAYGKGTPKISIAKVTELGMVTDNVTDISPLRALVGLTNLNCSGSAPNYKGRLADLSPLEGLPLTKLNCSANQVSDLSPLRGMSLTVLECSMSKISDLSPLQGMPLTRLNCNANPLADLSPLRGMPLDSLDCYATKVTDLSPLRELPLKTLTILSTPVTDLSPLDGMDLHNLYFSIQKITTGIETLRGMKNLKSLTIGMGTGPAISPEEFWKRYDADEFGKPELRPDRKVGGTGGLTPPARWQTPAFEAWVKATQALPADKQIEAVSKKLMELNPGFDGKLRGIHVKELPKIENGVVTEVEFFSENVSDISPLRALTGLLKLNCPATGRGGSQLSDLSPLEGMRLTYLHVVGTQVSDLSPLRTVPLTVLDVTRTKVSDLTSLKGMRLATLAIVGLPVSDLSPLDGMPLSNLYCAESQVADLSPLHNCKTLKQLDLFNTKVSAAGIEAIKEALPDCKINWDGAK